MRIQKKFRITILVLLAIISLLLIGWAVDSGNVGYYAIISALGGAILGVTIPTIIAIWISDDISELKEYLISVNSFVSAPSDVKDWDGLWYLYHTSKKDGEKRWLYEELNLICDSNVGTLKCASTIKLEDGTLKSYRES